jgi:hypothetical protein
MAVSILEVAFKAAFLALKAPAFVLIEVMSIIPFCEFAGLLLKKR